MEKDVEQLYFNLGAYEDTGIQQIQGSAMTYRIAAAPQRRKKPSPYKPCQ
ncbi:MAG: hypothetical protein HRU20_26825 [Pseudomonadales bacterium]|nr:hypothetical protein [Pseudomonadales bacterium]